MPARRHAPLIMLPVLAAFGFGAVGTAVYLLQSAVVAPPGLHLLPSSLDDLSNSSAYIATVFEQQPLGFITTYSLAYLFKQAFSMPGSLGLNALAGIAFGATGGVVITALLTAGGSSLAYLISLEFGAALLSRFGLQERILPLRMRVGAASKRGTLFFYLTAMRMTSFFPQWLINLASPHVGVPLSYFIPCTAIGTLPFNTITVSAGAAIASAGAGHSLSGALWAAATGWRTVAGLMCLAALCALPALCMTRLERALTGFGAAAAAAPAADSEEEQTPVLPESGDSETEGRGASSGSDDAASSRAQQSRRST